jgi:hypothetical protein
MLAGASLVMVVAAAAAAAADPAPAAPAVAGGGAFEDLAKDAVPVSDLGVLVAPFLEDCKQQKREVERTRCQAARASLQARLPSRRYVVASEGPEPVSLGAYDARLKGFRLAVAGCLACSQPVEAGPRGEKRFVTLKAPAPAGGEGVSLPAAVEVARTVMSFASVAESNAWLAASKAHLRAEFVFQPANVPWTMGATKGMAFRPVAIRVFNGCTGEVVFSQPPSRGQASSGDCARAGGARVAGGGDQKAEPPEGAGETLSPVAINAAMSAVRPDLKACVTQFKLPGTTFIAFTVAGSGIPQLVTVEGSAAGTALGRCLIDAATRAKFPPFGAEKQSFKYPVVVEK